MVTGRKLLLADDSVTIQKVIDLTFSDEGIEVTTVGNGEQALSKLEEIQPDIVLADIFMPGRNGYEVCEHIKRDERFRHIPVLLLVGSFEPFDESEARRVGADDYLTKPFQSIRQLVSKVTALISGSRGGDSEDEASTRDLELPEGAAKNQGRSPDEDIHTADTAPLPSELAGKDPAEAAAHLAGHESLDDEMIETRRPDEIAGPRETMGAEETRPTAPLSFSDLEEAGLKPSQPELEQQPAPPQETTSDFKSDEMNEEPLSTEPQPGSKPAASYMTNAAAADEALLDLGDIEPPVSTTEADDFILDLQDEAPSAPPAPAPFSPPGQSAEGAQTEVEAVHSSTSFGYSQATAGAHAPQFNEDFAPASYEAAESAATRYAEQAALPEAPGAEEPVSVLTTGEAGEAQDFSPRALSYPVEDEAGAGVPESLAEEKGFAASSEAVAAPAAGGQITLDQLSPEAIDAIARRAVELLSTKVVEEVAWEVVPQLAELLIKRKLEEEKT